MSLSSSNTPFLFYSEVEHVILNSLLSLFNAVINQLEGFLGFSADRRSIVVPSSSSGSERTEVSPYVVLGFVNSSSSKELSLNVPKVETVSPDSLEDKSGDTKDNVCHHDGKSVIISSVGVVAVLCRIGQQ